MTDGLSSSVPIEHEHGARTPSLVPKNRLAMPAQYLIALGIIALVTLAAFLFTPLVGAHSTALVFLLTVVVLALFVERGPTLLAAAVSALVWDYFFLPPVFAFRITHVEDAMLFGMYFVVALVLGHLTTRIRAQEETERERERRATALYLLTRVLNESVDLNQMVERIVHHLKSCFQGEVAVLLPGPDQQLRVHSGSSFDVSDEERSVAQEALQKEQRVSKVTTEGPCLSAIYFPLITGSGPVGVLCLHLNENSGLTVPQQNLADAFSQQIALALDRYRLSIISEQAKVLAESERLSKTLLDSMSHEVRTPIAAIQSATGNLAELNDTDTKTRHTMIAEIQEATERLNRLVSKILDTSRLEAGAVKPRFNECDVTELIHIVLADTEKELSGHKITTAIEKGLPMVRMDFVLMQQALTNLVSNSALHTPAGSAIEINARIEGESLLLSVADTGPGIPREYLPRIFDKFFRLPNSRTGGTGLGLSLVKGFVEAQGGQVRVDNRPGGGVIFSIELPPAKEAVPIHRPAV